MGEVRCKIENIISNWPITSCLMFKTITHVAIIWLLICLRPYFSLRWVLQQGIDLFCLTYIAVKLWFDCLSVDENSPSLRRPTCITHGMRTGLLRSGVMDRWDTLLLVLPFVLCTPWSKSGYLSGKTTIYLDYNHKALFILWNKT